MDILRVSLDALIDSLKIFPFLLLIFMVIAVIEESVDARKHTRLLASGYAPLVAAATGVIPQCGISVMAAKLFREGCISLGALIAAFISVSDEAVVLLITEGHWREFLILAAVKFSVALAVGYTVDAIAGGKKREPVPEDEFHGCHHHAGGGPVRKYFVHPLLHCLKTFAFVLVVNLALGLIIYFVGEDKFNAFMRNTGAAQPFVCALVGLIPNCGASVLIVELFGAGGINFAGLAAGLIANAGVGLVLLGKGKREIKVLLLSVAVLYFVGALVGSVIGLIL